MLFPLRSGDGWEYRRGNSTPRCFRQRLPRLLYLRDLACSQPDADEFPGARVMRVYFIQGDRNHV
jgi:hypothetical protein